MIIVGKWAFRGDDYAVASCRMCAPFWKEFQLAHGSHLIFGNLDPKNEHIKTRVQRGRQN